MWSAHLRRPALHGAGAACAVAGVGSALAWGFASPQVPTGHGDKDEVAFVYVWNPRRRAVMVCLHGGGFALGSGNEMNVYDGENLARHDVVVSLDHRVGAVGFLDLSTIDGEEYAASGNVACSTSWPRSSECGTTSRASAAIPRMCRSSVSPAATGR